MQTYRPTFTHMSINIHNLINIQRHWWYLVYGKYTIIVIILRVHIFASHPYWVPIHKSSTS